MDKSTGRQSSPFEYGLRSRLVLLLVVMLVPFLIFSGYQAYRDYDRLLKDRAMENTRDAREIANNVDELVQSTGDLLVALAHSKPAELQNFPELKKWFSAIAAKYPYYKNIIFVDMQGNIRAAANTYKKPDGKIIANVKDTAYYRRSIKASGLAYGNYMHGKISNKPVIHITYPVVGPKGRIGFIAIAFDLTRLQRRIVTVNIAHGSEVSVFDQNGTVIARTLDPHQWVGKCFRSNSILADNPSGKSVTGPGPDKVVRLMSFQATKRAPWLVAVCFEEDIIRKQALSGLLRQLGLSIPLLLLALFGWLWIGRDVDGLYKTAKRLGLADSLTSLGSYTKLNQDLKKDIARAKRHMQSLSLLLIDIDSLRRFNEISGVSYGNEALKRIADIVMNNLRDTDFAYRFGGDEIAVVLADTDELDAQEVAERIQRDIAQTEFATKDGRPASLSVSIGIGTYPLDASDAESLIQCATAALFEIKKAGEGNVMTYTQTALPSKATTSG